MRKILTLLAGLALIAGLGFSVAQQAVRTLQLSQDTTGAFPVDSSNNVYFPAHILTIGQTPTLSSCGTAGAAISGTDTAGHFITVSTTTACKLTFRNAYSEEPYCIVTAQNPATSPIAYNAAVTGINMTTVTGAVTGNYICSGLR